MPALQKSTLADFLSPDADNPASLDIGGSHVTVALVEHDTIAQSIVLDTDPTKSFQLCLDKIEAAGRELLKNCAYPGIRGLGMALPMLVNPATNRVLVTAREKYADAPQIELNHWSKACLGLPLKIEVDARAACIGEWLYGAGHGARNLVYVILGTGYGCSVILNGMPLRGHRGMAGVRGGHISVNAGPGQNECVCGGSGCAESEIGSWAIGENAKKAPGYQHSSLATYRELNYQILFQEAEQNDALAIALLDQNLRYLGVSLVNLIHAFDPEKIILAGAVMKQADTIIPRMNAIIRSKLWTDEDYPEVIAAQHAETAALLGMHALFGVNGDAN